MSSSPNTPCTGRSPRRSWSTGSSTAPASVPQIARVFVVVSEIFALDDYFDAVCALDNQVPTEVQVKLQHDYVRLLDRSSRWLVQQAPDSLDVDSGIEMYGKVVESLRSRVPDLVDGYDAETMQAKAQDYIDEGVPEELAWRAAALLVDTLNRS